MSDAVIEGRMPDGVPARLIARRGRIASVERLSDDEAVRALPYVASGLVDLQVNGLGGIDFNSQDLTPERVSEAVRLLLAQGVTTVFPTVITNDGAAIEALLRTIAAACEADPLAAACIGGIHLEGPFLSPLDGARGAHDAQFVRAPDEAAFQRWQEASGGRIRIVTLSPEWGEAAAFIAARKAEGVIASIGHTAASPEQIRNAVAAGASMSTHLGNGAQLMLPRHPNYIWEQLAADELTAFVIPDGFHLSDSVLKVFLRAKAGRIAFVSDAVYLCGLEPGSYKTHIGGEVVLTPEGRLHTAANPNILAGSAQMLIDGIARVAARGLLPFAEAWALGSAGPAAAAGLHGVGTLEPGAAADLVTFERNGADGRLRILDVYKNGSKTVEADRGTARNSAPF